MSTPEQFGKKEGVKMETKEAKMQRWQELLSQKKGLEAYKYAAEEGLIHSDHDVYSAMQVVADAMEEVVVAQDRAIAEGDEAEFNRLQAEYDRLDQEYNDIMTLRMENVEKMEEILEME